MLYLAHLLKSKRTKNTRQAKCINDLMYCVKLHYKNNLLIYIFYCRPDRLFIYIPPQSYPMD